MTTSNLTQRQSPPPTKGIGLSPTYQWAGTSPSHQQAPVPTSATRGTDTRSKRGYSSVIYKKVTTPKTYKNEKTEDYNSDEGERKTPPQNS